MSTNDLINPSIFLKMDILKIATDWVKIELVSNSVFILASIIFLFTSFFLKSYARDSGFFVYYLPLVIAAILLLILGAGLFFSTWQLSANLETNFLKDRQLFIDAELMRAEKTISQYNLAIGLIFPALGLVNFCILLIFQNDHVRASSVTFLVVLVILIIIDTAAKERLTNYAKHLEITEQIQNNS